MKRSCVVLQKGVIAQGEKENGSDKVQSRTTKACQLSLDLAPKSSKMALFINVPRFWGTATNFVVI